MSPGTMAFEQPVCSFCERTMQAFNDRDLYCSTRCRMADVEANPSPLSTTLQNMPSPTLEGATSRARPNQVRSYIRPLPPISIRLLAPPVLWILSHPCRLAMRQRIGFLRSLQLSYLRNAHLGSFHLAHKKVES